MSAADIIVARAEDWYRRGCTETSANRGVCVDQIHSKFDPAWIASKRNEAWCAKFVWVVADEAAQQLGVPNPMPRNASARGMLTDAQKAGLKVDTMPARGAVFYRTSSAPGASGHVGFVRGYGTAGKDLQTVEGNMDDRVGLNHYSPADLARLGFRFIHLEQALPSPTLLAGGGSLGLVLLASVGLGLWLQKGGRRAA